MSKYYTYCFEILLLWKCLRSWLESPSHWLLAPAMPPPTASKPSDKVAINFSSHPFPKPKQQLSEPQKQITPGGRGPKPNVPGGRTTIRATVLIGTDWRKKCVDGSIRIHST